jgi:3,4-dihydroxy 2-butanone 4-phosphate synthase / GTP cyclohydrolase II
MICDIEQHREGHGMGHRWDVAGLDVAVADGPTPRVFPVVRRAPAAALPVPGSRRPGAAGLSTIPEAIAAIRRGELVLVVDDHDRENEGDLVMAAAHVTPEAVNFMVTQGRGLVCLALTPERCDDLDLGPMVPENAGREETAFTVSIDFEEPGSTGISAADRARTIAHALDVAARPADFRRPGHVFPLRARAGGVLERPGHTEAAVDLARLAGLAPAGVICEVMSADGTMARLPELLDLADTHGLHLVTIADLIEYRRRTELLVERVADAVLPTPYGDARALGFVDHAGREHLALCFGDVEGSHGALVRVHSECLTGDVFGSLRCDCGEQLDAALRAIAGAGRGVVVYTRGHEGRGIGLVDKLRAYELQDCGQDTVEANLTLGHRADERDFLAAAHVLRSLRLSGVRLLTNNPAKEAALAAFEVDVAERLPIEMAPRPQNLHYLATKRLKLGHQLTVVPGDALTATS